MIPGPQQRRQRWSSSLKRRREQVSTLLPPQLQGSLTRVVGLTMEASGCRAPLGARCLVEAKGSSCETGMIESQVVGFSEDKLLLMPMEETDGVLPGAKVIPSPGGNTIPTGNDLLGRIIDGRGQPIDDLGPIHSSENRPVESANRNPLNRPAIEHTLDVGVRAINALLTVGKGQRMGLFAPAGVGKSTLLGMMTQLTEADVVVVGLIGERGREVQEFIQQILGPEALGHSVVVAAPADTPPLMRVNAANTACAVAEHFRDHGQQVLLLMDSLTRYAQALREIGLAIGEPPAMRGYSPSVFARIPRLVERAGTDVNGGSITAFYTVLTEGDPQHDPIGESARAILDGHIVLSRELAERGHFPAIDIEASISRLMSQIVSPQQQRNAAQFRKWLANWSQNRDLIDVGAYVPGSNAEIDQAIDKYPELMEFLQQATHENVDLQTSIQQLDELSQAPPAPQNDSVASLQ